MKSIYVLISIMMMALLVAACTPVTNPPGTTNVVFDPDEDVKADSFASVDQLKSFLRENQDNGGYYGGGMFREESFAMMDTAMANDAPMVKNIGSAESVDFSETNVQVEGVDEADILKSDGEYIYTITGKTLFIIKAYPGEDAEVISTINLDQRPEGLFINGDKLAVFGNFYDNDFFKEVDFSPSSGMTFFNIYDIGDKEDPELVEDFKFEGRYFQGRMKGDFIYFVVTSRPDYQRPIPMPVIFEGTTRTSVAIDEIYRYNIPYNNPQFATVHSIDFKQADLEESKTVTIEYNPNMYMSNENLYITYTENINEYELRRDITIDLMKDKISDVDKALIERIKSTANDILSKSEKDSKIYNIVQSYINYMDEDELDDLEDDVETKLLEKFKEYKYFEFTIIHKIGIQDGDIDVAGSGKVPGHVINQFSMDEYEDVFRIGTTVNARWSSIEKERTESTNHVFTLDEDLKIMDSLDDLAEGERIYSTRFMGEKLYMVTFRQVDPFFVIDLSNPNDIEALGELKIPGFSRYLHPYDENTIIGIGRDATETGRTRGLKISLFDVSDVENPEEIAKFVTDEKYAQSSAEYEHKAFLFDKDKELLVIPAYSYSYNDKTNSYNGAMVFKITQDDIDLRGLIDHSDGSENFRYGTAVERSMYIEDLLYTKSPNLLRINNLEDLESVKSVDLDEGYTGDIKIY